MTKRIFASLMAASIALTSVFSAPARAADSGEIARAVLGAGVLLYLGNELSKNNRGQVTRRYVEPRYNDGRDHRDHDYKPKHNKKFVPSACLRNNEYRDGPRQYFAMNCLNNNMRNANRLPRNCQTNAYTRRGWSIVYSAHCLRQNGWRFS